MELESPCNPTLCVFSIEPVVLLSNAYESRHRELWSPAKRSKCKRSWKKKRATNVFESAIATSLPRQIFSPGWKGEQSEESFLPLEKKEAKQVIINVDARSKPRQGSRGNCKEVEQVHGSTGREGYCYFSWSTSSGRSPLPPRARLLLSAAAWNELSRSRGKREKEEERKREERSGGRMIGSFLEIAGRS